jgi:hypothetical protein
MRPRRNLLLNTFLVLTSMSDIIVVPFSAFNNLLRPNLMQIQNSLSMQNMASNLTPSLDLQLFTYSASDAVYCYVSGLAPYQNSLAWLQRSINYS